MKFILGKKDGMTQLFDAAGNVVPVTAVVIEPNTVTQIKTTETDGYSAVQLAFGTRNIKRVTGAVKGHLKKAGAVENAAVLREFRVDSTDGFSLGQTIDANLLTEGDELIVASTSKGKGFQGVVKLHGFSGGRRSHGNKHAEREAGSIGGKGIQRVFKNLKMPGRMGSDRTTIKGLTVAKVDAANNRIFIKGALAGKRGDIIEIVTK